MSVTIKDHTLDFEEAFEAARKRGLNRIGQAAVGFSKGIITAAGAVVTGRLRNSITHRVKDDAVYIGTNVVYAKGIETGSHRRKGAVHFLKNAATGYSDVYKALMESEMRKG